MRVGKLARVGLPPREFLSLEPVADITAMSGGQPTFDGVVAGVLPVVCERGRSIIGQERLVNCFGGMAGSW